MPEPWFDPGLFAALYGGIGGGLCVGLVGLTGRVGGSLARKGRRVGWVQAVLTAVSIAGTMSLIIGLIAWVIGQPRGIWVALAAVGSSWFVAARSTSAALQKRYENAPKVSISEPPYGL